MKDHINICIDVRSNEDIFQRNMKTFLRVQNGYTYFLEVMRCKFALLNKGIILKWFNVKRMIKVLEFFRSDGVDVCATLTHRHYKLSLLDIVCRSLHSRDESEKEVVVCFVKFAQHAFGIQFNDNSYKTAYRKINLALNRESAKKYFSWRGDFKPAEVCWLSRRPFLNLIEGCGTANCETSRFLSDDFIMRGVCSFMELQTEDAILSAEENAMNECTDVDEYSIPVLELK